MNPWPLPSTDQIDQIYEQHDRLGALLALLPELNLGPRARMVLSGYLFPEGPTLVLSVSAALQDDPQEGPRARELRGRLHRAIALCALERLLQEAARRAGELALCDQAEAVREAMAILRAARHSPVGPGARRRLDRLRPALHVLQRRAARARRARRTGQPQAPSGV
ncbi:MAG: hypothetical protein NZ890_14850 [Myxococcota bacterium]|nr:hypothetical protein [Myxococcota bacterium]